MGVEVGVANFFLDQSIGIDETIGLVNTYRLIQKKNAHSKAHNA